MSNPNINPIIFEIEYGCINTRLNEIMTSRKISNYQLSNQANIRFQTIQSLRDNTATRIDFEVLAKLCYALDCKVEDLIIYSPKKE